MNSLIKLIFWITIGFSIGFGYRKAMHYYAKETQKGVYHNINNTDRIQRFFIFLALASISKFLLNNNPIMFIVSGFTLFEAVGSWCVVNAMLGKSNCDL